MLNLGIYISNIYIYILVSDLALIIKFRPKHHIQQASVVGGGKKRKEILKSSLKKQIKNYFFSC